MRLPDTDASFPPFHLLDRDYLAEARDKQARVERLYHVGQRHAWDGRGVLSGLLAQHAPGGKLQVDREKRQAMAAIFTPILWGELAAWNVAADLALRLSDTGAKMAATGQAFDEARHFYVLRDYLMLLDVDLPRLDGFVQTVLRDLLETESLVEKLLGMQLIVENVAVALFRAVARAGIEPVLSGLLPYLERDEARHVGLGMLYLPELLRELRLLPAARLRWLQLKMATLIGWSTQRNRPAFEGLGVDTHESLRLGLRLQNEVINRMTDGQALPGLVLGSAVMERFNDLAVELFFPSRGTAAPWQAGVINLCERLAGWVEPALRT